MAVSMTDCKAISLVLKSSTQFVREHLSIELDEVQDTNEQEQVDGVCLVLKSERLDE